MMDFFVAKRRTMFTSQPANRDYVKETNEEMSIERTAGFWNIYFMGISLVFADLLVSWPDGLSSGFWEYVVTTGVMGIGYMFLMLCLAEMTSILPFGGGAYGLTRVTLGPFAGYMIGCLESFGFIMYVAIAVVPIGQYITFTANSDSRYEPIYWLIIYAASLTILIYGRKSFFTFTTTLGIITVLLVVIYLLGTASDMSLPRYVTRSEGYRVDLFPTGAKGFVSLLPVSAWWFIGIDAMPLVCSDAIKAKFTVPRAMVAAMCTILIFSFAVLFATSSQYPGVTALSEMEDGVPLNFGYQQMINIDFRLSTILSLPGLFISNYAFMYAYGKQVYSMSRSQLLPSILSHSVGDLRTPYAALICGAFIGYICMLGIFLSSNNNTIAQTTLDYIYNACQIGSFVVYIAIFTSFIIFRTKYYTLQRNYVNKLGIVSAVVGICVFVVALVGVSFLQEDHYISIIMFTCFSGISAANYFCYAQPRQCFSPEEQSILFVVYVIKANERRRLFSKVYHRRPSIDSTSRSSLRRTARQNSCDHTAHIAGDVNNEHKDTTPPAFVQQQHEKQNETMNNNNSSQKETDERRGTVGCDLALLSDQPASSTSAAQKKSEVEEENDGKQQSEDGKLHPNDKSGSYTDTHSPPAEKQKVARVKPSGGWSPFRRNNAGPRRDVDLSLADDECADTSPFEKDILKMPMSRKLFNTNKNSNNNKNNNNNNNDENSSRSISNAINHSM